MLKLIEETAWCKPDWHYTDLSDEAKDLLKQCADSPKPELVDDLNEIMKRSDAFPIPFPIETVRIQSLKERRPLSKLKRNIKSTYPLIHERALNFMGRFLILKREYGTCIEKALYKDMSLLQFIDRLLKKRSVTFMGRHDSYMLLSGEKSNNGWEAVGTSRQKPPLVLENCLSYDEMKLSSHLYVSGYTECINNGTRKNCGKVNEDDVEDEAIVIGFIGPRFKRKNRMDYEDIVITKDQNKPENGYGKEPPKNSALQTVINVLKNGDEKLAKYKLRELWTDFFQVPNATYNEALSKLTNDDKSEDRLYKDRYISLPVNDYIFDNEAYYKRISILAETTIIEANYRGSRAKKSVFLNIVGAGLGVWRISDHQNDVYVLSIIERVKAFLDQGLVDHISDINFAYIQLCNNVLALFEKETKDKKSKKHTLFLESKKHPKGGITIHVENREPAAKLAGEHEGKLLVMTYPWDSNAQPGNEFWERNLKGSGDSAAASSTQVSELHNSLINPMVTAQNIMVLSSKGVKHITEYFVGM